MLAAVALAGIALAPRPALAQCQTPASPLIDLWAGDVDANDYINAANSGSFVDTATSTGLGLFSPSKFGQGFSFDGSAVFLVPAPAGAPIGSAPRTVEFWFYASADPALSSEDSPLFQYGSDSPGQTFGLVISGLAGTITSGTGAGAGKLYFFTSSAGVGGVAGSHAVTPNAWHHVAVTYDGTKVTLYLDGALDGSSTIALNTRLDVLYAGFSPEGTGFFLGTPAAPAMIDEIALYSVALGAAAVQADAAAANAFCVVGPFIAVPPASQIVGVGANVTLQVVARGQGSFNYQWQFKDAGNWVNISGKTSATLTLTDVQTSSAGEYRVTVTTVNGTATSDAATLVVGLAPVISQQPVALTQVLVGSPVSLSVTASGAPTLTYQWRKEGVDLTGKTDASLSWTNAVLGDSGNYQVVVANAYGGVTSSVAVVQVGVAPTISQQPTNLVLDLGASGAFTVLAAGTEPLTYQWRKAGVFLPGATTSSLSFTAVQLGDAGSYDVVVTNAYGAVTSAAATLSMRPRVTVQPSAQTVALGGSASLSVTASGTQPLSYRWFFNDVELSDGPRTTGSQASTLLITGLLATDDGYYKVVVTNAFGSDTSLAVKLTVAPPPVAGNLSAATLQGQPLVLSRTKLLACASGPGNTSLSLVSVSPASTNGSSVTVPGDTVIYSPSAGFVGADRFSYTVKSDVNGLQATGYVLVQVGATDGSSALSANLLPPSQLSPGPGIVVRFLGIPGRTYTVNRWSLDTNGPWTVLGTATVDATGLGTLTDSSLPSKGAFYRTTYP